MNMCTDGQVPATLTALQASHNCIDSEALLGLSDWSGCLQLRVLDLGISQSMPTKHATEHVDGGRSMPPEHADGARSLTTEEGACRRSAGHALGVRRRFLYPAWCTVLCTVHFAPCMPTDHGTARGASFIVHLAPM